MRAFERAAASAKAAQPRPDGTTFAPVWHRADEPAVLAGHTGEAADPAPRHVLEEDALHRILGAVVEDLLAGRLHEVRHRSDPAR